MFKLKREIFELNLTVHSLQEGGVDQVQYTVHSLQIGGVYHKNLD